MKDITPKHLRCAVHSSCPSVHVVDDGRLLIVGEVIKDGDCVWFKEGEPSAHVGPNEAAVVISADLLSELPEVKRLREKIRQLNSANIALNQALSEAEEIEVKLRDRIEKITKSMGARIKELEARVEALEKA